MPDYFVGGYDIKDIQKKMLEILVEVDRVCKKHNIKYILDSGTVLGAMRHKGFIPWDDDIDIGMLREDYERFCEVAPKELRTPYVFENMYTRKDYPNIFGKCYDTSTKYVQHNTAHLDIQHGIFLDVFPMDNVEPKDKKTQCRIVASLNTVRCIKQKTEPFSLRHCLYLPLFLLPIKSINRLVDSIMKKHYVEETELVCPVCQSGTRKPMFKRTMFTDTIDAEFEGLFFPVPREYDEFMLGYYSNPYELPPEEKRNPTHGIVEVKL